MGKEPFNVETNKCVFRQRVINLRLIHLRGDEAKKVGTG